MTNTSKDNKLSSVDAGTLDFLPGTLLQLSYANVDQPIRCVYVGMEKDKYLLVRVPQQGTKTCCPPNTEVTVKFMHYAGLVGGFKTTVAAGNEKPFPLLFLHYPKKLEVLNLREHNRVACFFPAFVVQDQTVLDGVIVNISAGGCLFTVKTDQLTTQLEPGMDVQTIFQPMCKEDEMLLTGTIRTISNRETSVDIGISFSSTSGTLPRLLAKYVEQVETFLERHI